jgi:transaldolase
MKLFIDSANLEDIEKAFKRGIVRGVTTNPSLLAKEPKVEFEKHISKIVSLIRRYNSKAHLSVEVFSQDSKKILCQARRFKKIFKLPSLSVKVQIGWDELEIIHRLSEEGVSVNCTACMTVGQAILAAQAGAKFVSLFWGRIRDGKNDNKFKKQYEQSIRDGILSEEDFDPAIVVKKTREIIDRQKLKAEIIVGSIRGVKDIIDAGIAGAHIVTVPPKFFSVMASHFKTDEVVDQFLQDFAKWVK